MATSGTVVLMIGIDEVGRGAWAGPLLICAARLRTDIVGLADSKVLSAKKREELAEQITKQADIGYGWVYADELDRLGLAQALRVAAERAVTAVAPKYKEAIIIDGTINLLPGFEQVQTIIKADASVPCVSAASIVAKVARDKYMAELAVDYPSYAFEKHVGYGTAIHKAAILRHGFCLQHRRSFRLPEPA